MKIVTLAFLLLGVSAVAFAVTESNDLYSVDADEILVDNENNVKTYKGNTRIVVSNLVIEADSVSVFSQGGLPARIEASGNPISFKEKVPKDNISGTALSVTFDVAELKLTLTEYSIVDPTGNNMKGRTLSIVLTR